MTEEFNPCPELYGIWPTTRNEKLFAALKTSFGEDTAEDVIRILHSHRVFTLVTYRPDHTDYCRGCAMDSTTSEGESFVFYTLDDLAVKYAQFEEFNKNRGRGYGETELTVYVDGELLDSDTPDYFSLIQKVADERERIADRKAKEESDRRHREAVALNAKLAKEAAEKRLADQQQLRELINTYGIPNDLKE